MDIYFGFSLRFMSISVQMHHREVRFELQMRQHMQMQLQERNQGRMLQENNKISVGRNAKCQLSVINENV